MRKILILAKTLLKGGGSSSDQKGRRRWWIVIILLIAFVAFGFSVGFMALGLYDVLDAIGAADALITLALGATSVVIFMFGIFYTVSVMYHADDISLLLALPLRPYQILGAKFFTLVVYEYIFEAFILVPLLVVYGIKSGGGVPYILYSVLLFLLLPVIALVMASVLIMLVMRFTRFGKNKQLFNYIGGIIAMVLAIGFNILIQSSVRNVSSEQLVAIVTGEASLSALLSHIFPGIGMASDALTGSASVGGLLSLLLFILCSGLAFGVFLLFGQLFYFKGLSGVTEASAKRRKISRDELGKQTESTSIVRAYLFKELRLLVRSPIAFMNCVLINFIWPVLLLVMVFSGGNSLGAIGGLISGMDQGLIIAFFVGMSAFVSSANAVTSTAISREGKTIYFLKYIPVPLRKQLLAKVLSGFLLACISIAMLTVAGILLGLSAVVLVIALVLSIGAAAASSFAGLVIDAANPKLGWMNEQQAIKQNLNVMLHMLFGLVFALAVVLPVMLSGMETAAAVAYITVIVSLATVFFGLRVSRGSVRKLEKMDV